MNTSHALTEFRLALPDKLNLLCLDIANGDPELALCYAVEVIERRGLLPLCDATLATRKSRKRYRSIYYGRRPAG